jgi:hypothetical protein
MGIPSESRSFARQLGESISKVRYTDNTSNDRDSMWR